MTDIAKPVVNHLTVETTMPIFWADLSHLPEHLLMARQAIDELRVSHPDSVQSNVRSVYMSPWKSHQLNAKLVPICQTVTDYAKQAALQHMNTDLSRLNWGLQVTDCWARFTRRPTIPFLIATFRRTFQPWFTLRRKTVARLSCLQIN